MEQHPAVPGPFNDPDIALMLAFQNGDEASFEQLVLKHQKAVLNVVFRYLGDRSRAEDGAQDVFIKVYRARHSYKPQAKFSTWLYRIAVNHCLNELRSRRSAPAGPAPIDDVLEENVAHTPDAGLNRADLQRAVKEAIDALPENQRVAVILARYEELSYEEIAEAMQVSLEAVKSLLFRAKENLKLRLQKWVSPDR